MYNSHPYTRTVNALKGKYGQPRQLDQSELQNMINLPSVKLGESDAFDIFALSVQSLVGTLRTLEAEKRVLDYVVGLRLTHKS